MLATNSIRVRFFFFFVFAMLLKKNVKQLQNDCHKVSLMNLNYYYNHFFPSAWHSKKKAKKNY